VPDNNQAVTKADLDQALGAAVRQLTDYIDERTRDLQTELLRAFVGYNNSAVIRFAKLGVESHR